jgi:uncharacterized damage-inducible protein DinB
MHPRIETLLLFMQQAWGPRAWHGSGLKGSLRGIPAKQAMWRPGPGRHTIRELVLHMAYWKYTLVRRLGNMPRGSFPRDGSNWIPVSDPTEKGWRADIALLHEVHAQLEAAVRNFPAERLDERDGSKWTYAEQIAGIAAHDLYHTGQVQLLKRLSRGQGRR